MRNILFLIMKRLVSLMVILTLITGANAQARYLPKANTDISISFLNVTQPTDRTLEFDVYLLDTDPAQPFELAGVQLGFLFNALIYTGGTVTGALDNTNSGLNTLQKPTKTVSIGATLTGYPNQSLFRLASNAPPGTGSGTIISATSPGTLMTHVILTSTVPWTTESQPNIVFNSSEAMNPLYATKISEYIAGVNTELTVTPGTNALVCCNPNLNPIGTGLETNKLIKINIFSANKKIFIECPNTAKQISVYNMLGSLIATEKNITRLCIMNMNNFSEEYYLVKVVTSNSVTTRKILLK